jgi:hypothetical protein
MSAHLHVLCLGWGEMWRLELPDTVRVASPGRCGSLLAMGTGLWTDCGNAGFRAHRISRCMLVWNGGALSPGRGPVSVVGRDRT